MQADHPRPPCSSPRGTPGPSEHATRVWRAGAPSEPGRRWDRRRHPLLSTSADLHTGARTLAHTRTWVCTLTPMLHAVSLAVLTHTLHRGLLGLRGVRRLRAPKLSTADSVTAPPRVHCEAGHRPERRPRPYAYLAPWPSCTLMTHSTGYKLSQLATRSLHFSSNVCLVQSTDESK